MVNRKTGLPCSARKVIDHDEMFHKFFAVFHTCSTFSVLQETCQGLKLLEVNGTAKYPQENELLDTVPAFKNFSSGIVICFSVTVKNRWRLFGARWKYF